MFQQSSIFRLRMTAEESSPISLRPSTTDRARTITNVCGSGTLCTSSALPDMQGHPFGSYVDFITDENGELLLFCCNAFCVLYNNRMACVAAEWAITSLSKYCCKSKCFLVLHLASCQQYAVLCWPVESHFYGNGGASSVSGCGGRLSLLLLHWKVHYVVF